MRKLCSYAASKWMSIDMYERDVYTFEETETGGIPDIHW